MRCYDKNRIALMPRSGMAWFPWLVGLAVCGLTLMSVLPGNTQTAPGRSIDQHRVPADDVVSADASEDEASVAPAGTNRNNTVANRHSATRSGLPVLPRRKDMGTFAVNTTHVIEVFVRGRFYAQTDQVRAETGFDGLYAEVLGLLSEGSGTRVLIALGADEDLTGRVTTPLIIHDEVTSGSMIMTVTVLPIESNKTTP
jgi:hypothetical protein